MTSLLKLSVMLLFLTAVIAGAGMTANADPVTYSTQGCFGAGCTPIAMTSTMGSGTALLTFTGQAPVTIGTPTQTGLGVFHLSGTGTFAPIAFTLQITQTFPTPTGTGSFTATVSGMVQEFPPVNSSSVGVSFAVTTITINGVTYSLRNLDGSANNVLLLNAPNTGSPPGDTTVTALVAVPEPTSMLLLGTGLMGVAAGVRRRLRGSAN